MSKSLDKLPIKKKARQRILEAAAESFQSLGYARTTTQAIATKAGVAEVTLFRHFGDKQNLFLAVAQQIGGSSGLGQLEGQLTYDLETDLLMISQYILAFFLAQQDGIRMLMFETTHFPEMMGTLAHTPRGAMQLLASYFQKQMEAGHLQKINPSATAQAFISMLFGYAVGLEPVQALLPTEISLEAMTAEFVRIQLQRLAVLPETDKTIAGSLDLHLTLSVLLEQVQLQLEVDAAAILLYQPELSSLEFTAGQGFHTDAIQSASVRFGEGPAGRVALERRIVNISDLSQLENGFAQLPEFRKQGFVSYIGSPLIARGKIVGVLEIYHRQLLEPDSEWMTILTNLSGQAAISIDYANLLNGLKQSNLELGQAYDATIEGWVHALEMRAMETEGHCHRVVALTMELAQKMNIREEELAHIRRGALMHDIGKMGVPDSILQKAGKPTDEEQEIMRQHPVYAFEWISNIDYLRPALDIPYCHHESFDGTGYPRGLKGKEIPLAARIFSVVDVWDALLSDRPYRKAWTKEKTMKYIQAHSGTQFDPQVVKAFLEVIEEEGHKV